MARTPTVFHWSGGKDSAQALLRLLDSATHEVVGLVTTTSALTRRSTVHGTPPPLIRAQADAIGLPLEEIELPGRDLDGYLAAMDAHARRLVEDRIGAVAFGDLSASGILSLKEEQFGAHGLTVVEPLWGLSSPEVMTGFLASGIRARCVVVDADVLDRSFLGRGIDSSFVSDLPAAADVCGELGEYHSFVHDAPFFSTPVEHTIGEPVLISSDVATTDGVRTFSWWCLPVEPAADSGPVATMDA